MYQKQTLHFEDNDKAFSCIELKKKLFCQKIFTLMKLLTFAKLDHKLFFAYLENSIIRIRIPEILLILSTSDIFQT